MIRPVVTTTDHGGFDIKGTLACAMFLAMPLDRCSLDTTEQMYNKDVRVQAEFCLGVNLEYPDLLLGMRLLLRIGALFKVLAD